MPFSAKEIKMLREKSIMIKLDILYMLYHAGSGHTGGSLSTVEILLAIYSYMKHRPEEPKWEERDRFVLSKGHAAPALYTVLADKGYFCKQNFTQLGYKLDKPALQSFRQMGSPLQGHPFSRVTPGIEASTGSLGQGLSIANGMAMAAKLNNGAIRIYALLGDGEQQEGQVWEAAMSAAHYKLDNLCVFIDHNELQIDGRVNEIMAIKPLQDKWKAFGWHVVEIDGHNFRQIFDALETANKFKGKPTVIIAHTIKGKGVSFMENDPKWHGITPNAAQYQQAKQELEDKLKKLREEEGDSNE